MADETQESGFEYKGIFYPWHVTTRGHDLLLIDRISAMSPLQFFELVEDGYDLSRASVTLSLVATSMRNRHPERSLERIVREVLALDLDEVEFIGGEDEEAEESPPAPAGEKPASPSPSSSAASKSSPASTAATSPATSVSSGNQASAISAPA